MDSDGQHPRWVLFFLVLPHANPYSLIFAFPLWLLAALVGYTYTKHWAWLPACLTLMWLVEYGYRYKTNVHAGYQPAEITRVGDAIKQVEKPTIWTIGNGRS